MARPLVAVALELDYPARRHLDVLAGIQGWVEQHDAWDFRLDEKIVYEPGGRLGRYAGVIARATPALASAAAKRGIPVVNVWQNSPVAAKLPGVFPDGKSIGAAAAGALLLRGFSSFACGYFTEDAMDKVCAIYESSRCQFIGRSKASKHHGCPYEEQFGFSLLPEHHAEVSAAIEHVKQALQSGVIKGCTGWATYRHLHGLPLRKHKIRGDFVEIDDFTDDFDFPIDYERWKTHFYGGQPVEAKHGFFKRLFAG